MHQQYSKESQENLRGWPLWEVEGGQKVLDKVVKQWPEIIFFFSSTTPDDTHRIREREREIKR